jgi:CheY-like chemotaxis protein/two-component sensor histidine kinase
MVRQVDDLLDVSRISRGKIELRKERTELAEAVKQAVEAVRPVCDSLTHEMIVTVPSRPLILHADPTRLAQIIDNLLNNACKFTDEGGRIWLSVEQEDLNAVIRVRDTGIGIADEERCRIFEIFAQVDKSLERARVGLGLGLALVKNLVELHGGSVEVLSPGLGKGSEFIVRLPLSQVAEPAESPRTDEITASPTESRRVLVADDNRDSAESLAMLLSHLGHEVVTAHDGLEAVSRAAEFQADVILLDIGMPRLIGYEAARRIRALSLAKRPLIVAVTGWGREDERRRSDEAGFDAHLVKPVDLTELMNLLRSSRPS